MYADSATGTPEFNKELSLKRAQAVVDVLVKAYGISADRLKISADGGVDKFGQPILNREVLVKSAIKQINNGKEQGLYPVTGTALSCMLFYHRGYSIKGRILRETLSPLW